MRVATIIVSALLLLGCASNMEQYANNYKNNTIYGTWDEVGSKALNELVLQEDGKFSFTAFPFETYKDYWGSYSIDRKRHRLHFTIEGGNNVPKDAKLQNVEYAFDKSGHLVLKNYYYGTVAKEVRYSLFHTFKRYP